MCSTEPKSCPFKCGVVFGKTTSMHHFIEYSKSHLDSTLARMFNSMKKKVGTNLETVELGGGLGDTISSKSIIHFLKIYPRSP